MTPRIKPAKTECWFCGNVWQEHTLNEVGACMAMMHMQFPDPNESLEVEICPVCSKLPAEHSDAELRACRAKWRKRKRGSTRLAIQCESIEGRVEGRVQNEEPDPVKLAQLRAQWLKALCPCGKAFGDHTQDEIMACAPRNRRS